MLPTISFWISTNEFPISTAGFNGAQIYALDKVAMAAGTDANMQYVLEGGPLAEGIAYTVQPATIPPGGAYASVNNGTQYFLSTLEFFGGLDNRLAMWAATVMLNQHYVIDLIAGGLLACAAWLAGEWQGRRAPLAERAKAG